MLDSLRIADIDFLVTSATLDAFVDESKLCWGLSIDATTDAPEFADWHPRVSSDVLFVTGPHEFDHWLELAPRSTAWTEKNDTDEIPSAFLYVFEHNPIYECATDCYVQDGQLRIRMRGKCDVHFSHDKYYDNLDIEVESALDFVGILCGNNPEVVCRQKLGVFLHNEDFDFSTTEHGVSVLKPI